MIDCVDGLCGLPDCVECNPDLLCPYCRQEDDACVCEDEACG